MDKKYLYVYIVLTIILIAGYLYINYTSEKRAQEAHDLELKLAKANAAHLNKIQSEAAEAAITMLKSIPGEISKIKITQVVEKKPLITIKLPFSNRQPLQLMA